MLNFCVQLIYKRTVTYSRYHFYFVPMLVQNI